MNKINYNFGIKNDSSFFINTLPFYIQMKYNIVILDKHIILKNPNTTFNLLLPINDIQFIEFDDYFLLKYKNIFSLFLYKTVDLIHLNLNVGDIAK